MNDRPLCTACSRQPRGQAAKKPGPVPADFGIPSRFRVYMRTAFVLLLLGACGLVLWEAAGLSLRLTFAEDQTEQFEECRARALRSDAAEAAACLKFIVNYHPSGTKQTPGSRLDRLVERERSRAVRDVIAHLRAQTGLDLGDDPEGWVRRFAGE
jgi:hypothetical protein